MHACHMYLNLGENENSRVLAIYSYLDVLFVIATECCSLGTA